MGNNLNELEARKAELEKVIDEKREYAKSLEADISILEQLIALKRAHNKTMYEINELGKIYNDTCAEIELFNAKPEAESVKESENELRLQK